MSTIQENILQVEAAAILKIYSKERERCHSIWSKLEGFEWAPTDVFVTSFLKSGTTLTQQLVYQLLVVTGRVSTDPSGDSFCDITNVVPTIELRKAFGVHKSIHEYTPRIWKSHLAADDFKCIPPSSGKFIYCVRNGLATGRSFLDFTLDWIFSNERQIRGQELRAELYKQWFMCYFLGLQRLSDFSYEREKSTTGNWFKHVQGWINAKRDNLYFLVYEDAIKDMAKAVREVAKFLGITVSPSEVEHVVSKCNRDYMAKDPRFLDVMMSDAMGWDRKGGLRVRPLDAPGFKDIILPDECIAMFNQMFRETFDMEEHGHLVDLLRRRNAVVLSKLK